MSGFALGGGQAPALRFQGRTRRLSVVVFLLLALLPSRLARAADLELQPKTKIEFATKEQAAKLLSARDTFVQALSPFDRAARLKTDQETTEKAYLDFVASQAAEWTDDERKRVEAVLTDLGPSLRELKLSLPPVIRFLKTTGKEEGEAAYCRGASIVLPEKMLGAGSRELESIVPHEIFHVYSSHNSKAREALYGVLGFKTCAPVKLPESLAKRKLTNPDAPGLDVAIEVKDGARKIPVLPVIYSRSKTYDAKKGGEFFDYLEFRLMVLEKDGKDWKPALDEKGEPRLRTVADTPDYLEQVGKNTGYVIHPEEILADNFVHLVRKKENLPSPRIVEGMRKVFADLAK